MLDLRDPCRSTHQHDIIHLVLADLCILQHLEHRVERLLENVVRKILQFGSRDSRHVIFPFEESIDLNRRGGGRRKCPLGSLTRRMKSSDRSLIGRHVQLCLALEILHTMIHQKMINILTTKMCVTRGRLDLKHTVLDGKEGNVESSTTEIKYKHIRLFTLFIKPVRNRCRCGLIDDAQHVQSRDRSGILGRLAALIIKISRHRDHTVLDFLSHISIRYLLHLGEDHRANLLRRQVLLLPLMCDPEIRFVILVDHLRTHIFNIFQQHRIIIGPSNKTLRIENSIRRIKRHLVLRRLSHQTFISKCSPAGGCSVSLVIGNNLHSVVLKNTNT